ncbi:DUF4365 domain-containing protein [Catenulispora rubra]|uniref:DUF4365 domain-containing protein n=1 Tax=Catenulispora rubra TaxID=280293 RepID=UPI00189206B0|nr:DUF4365 domain-containing protein [Catenulispora rubra]
MTPEQKIDRAAMNAVEKVFIDNGHCPEQVRWDFGEDLLIQTDRATQADSLWIRLQVKGTANDRRRSARVTAWHINKWAHSADPVLIVLWNVNQDRGWYSLVEPYSANWSGSNIIRFRREDVFDAESAERLVWEFRFHHEIRNLLFNATVLETSRQQCIHLLLMGFQCLWTAIYEEHHVCRPVMGEPDEALDAAAGVAVQAVRDGVDAVEMPDDRLVKLTREALGALARAAKQHRVAVSHNILDAVEAVETLIRRAETTPGQPIKG